jgi:hypothetical protein
MTTNRTKADLEKEVDDLKGQLEHEVRQAAVLSHAPAQPTMVPIKNYGGTVVTVSYEILGNTKYAVLDISGLRQTASIPLDRWLELERDSKLVGLGYIARTDQPVTNPNVIPDVIVFVEDLKEQDIVSRLESIENPNVLHRINDYLAPKEDRTAREGMILEEVRNRIFELTNLRITSVDPMGE